MKLRTLALTGAMSVAGLGLVGAGAHAAFTTSTTSSQTITAGTLSMELTGPSGSTCTATNVEGNCGTLALPAYGPTQSTFDSGPVAVTATNDGNITATNIKFSLTDTTNNAANSVALNNEVYVCVTADQGNGTSAVLANESLTAFEATPIPVAGTEVPGGTAPYTIEFFAGAVKTLCGNHVYGESLGSNPAPLAQTIAPASGLDPTAMGGVINPAFTATYSG